MLKKFALMLVVLVAPSFGFAQDEVAPPAPVPVAEGESAVVVGQGCVGCGTSSMGSACGSACDPCDPCARPARTRLLTRRSGCGQAASCCTPAPVACCTPAPAACCGTSTVADNCCSPAPRTRMIARRSNCCQTPASPCGVATTSVASGCCGTVATVSGTSVSSVAQVSYVSECDQPAVRTGLRPFSGSVLRRAR